MATSPKPSKSKKSAKEDELLTSEAIDKHLKDFRDKGGKVERLGNTPIRKDLPFI